MRIPLDFFLRALSEDRKERGIGVILSGMGSDGTLGLRAIKERAGLALVQDPATAKFEMMPRSVIDAGLADVVASPEELAARIVQYSQRLPHKVEKGQDIAIKGAVGAIEKVTILLRNETGHDLSSGIQLHWHRFISVLEYWCGYGRNRLQSCVGIFHE